MPDPTLLGARRFTCLSPTLVRMEFSPDGTFEDRPSMVAREAKTPLAFESIDVRQWEGANWTVLSTGRMEVWSREDDRPFNRLNLEIRWEMEGLTQFWRPGDRDYQNLGGTIRSLDRYAGELARLDGVHPATAESPDPSATNWPAWHQCEINPPYAALHPDPPARYNKGSWLRLAASGRNDGTVPHRTFNWYVDARRYAPGLLSRSGYFFLDDSDGAALDADGFPVERTRPGALDHYFFAYGLDYPQALADWRHLAGPAPLPPRQSLGIMFSRWPAFTEAEVETMVERFNAEGYPLSVIILDMEWHREGWGHWDVNPELIPDLEAFCRRCHDAGLQVVFNDHPLDVRSDDSHYQPYLEAAGEEVYVRPITYNEKTLEAAKVDITHKQQNQAFIRTCHQPLLDAGLDWWWNDGSRGQMSGTSGQLVANKSFFEEIEARGRRGMLLARYGGLGSHRYGGFFTGDTGGDWHMLTTQVEFNIRAGHLGHAWISHDIGGFMAQGRNPEKIDPALYLRWLQFGVFNPLLRFHSAPGAGSRLPYDYEDDVNGACRKWLRERHALLPYLYTAGRLAYDTGLPITRGLFLEWPEDERAYRYDAFFFGPSLLVAPVTAESQFKRFYLPPGTWYERASGRRVAGDVELGRRVPLDEVPVLARAGSVIPTGDPDAPIHAAHVDPLVLEIYPPEPDDAATETGCGMLYEDDGRSAEYHEGPFCRTHFVLGRAGETLTLHLATGEGEPLAPTRHIRAGLPRAFRVEGARVNGAPLEPSAVSCGEAMTMLDLGERSTAEPLELELTIRPA